MNAQPVVKLYTLDGTEIWLGAKTGNLGQSHLISFTYKYSETEPEEATLRLGFTKLEFTGKRYNLQLLQPGVGMKIRFGYLGVVLSEQVELAIDDAEYSYSLQGYVVSLKLISLAAYKAKGNLLKPDGSTLTDAFVQVANEVGPLFEYTTSSKAVVTAQDNLKTNQPEYGYKDPLGNVRGFKLAEEPISHTISEVGPDQWDRGYYQYYKLFAGASANRGAGLDQSTPGFGEANLGPKPKNPVPDLTPREQGAALYDYYQKLGSTIIVQHKGDKTVTKEPDWLAEASRYYIVGRNIISYKLEKSDKETRITGVTYTQVDPLTAQVMGSKIIIGDEFFFRGVDPKTRGTFGNFKFWATGNSYYMINLDTDGAEPVSISAALFSQRQKQSITFQELLNRASKYEVDNAIFEGTDKTLEEALKEKVEQELTSRRIEAEKHGFDDDAVNTGLITVKYSGRTIQDVKGQAIKAEMDKIFYNSKLTLKVEGDPTLIDGINITFMGGNPLITGVYHADEIEHNITKTGFVTNLVAYRVLTEYTRMVNEFTAQVGEEIDEKIEQLTTTEQLKGVESINISLHRGEKIEQESAPEYESGNIERIREPMEANDLNIFLIPSRNQPPYTLNSADSLQSLKLYKKAGDDITPVDSGTFDENIDKLILDNSEDGLEN